MADTHPQKKVRARLDERGLSIVVHSLFSSWMLGFLFEGQVFYALAGTHNFVPTNMVFSGAASIFAGLLLGGLIIRTKRAAKRLFLCSYLFFAALSLVFFFPPSILWTLGVISGSFLSGGCVATWAFYLKSGTPKNERIKTVADMLILSNILMITLNLAAIHISPHAGLLVSICMLLCAFAFALKLPEDHGEKPSVPGKGAGATGIAGPLVFLCVFIAIISINAGLMYQVINPAFSHIAWLISWYWAVPYIAALIVIRNLPQRVNRAYMLYVAIAMIGLSFIGFMSIGRTAMSYIAVNTLMLGACGVYDLFWWSILGEMLEFHNNPARILGIGLSANVLGVLLGGLIGNVVISANTHSPYPALLALSVVCVTLALLPPLNKYLSSLLKGHAYLTEYTQIVTQEPTHPIDRTARFGMLSERESQVTSLLLQGKTYRKIADELFISENTVKYYVKNIYSKFNIQSRAELIDIMLENRTMPR